LIVKPAKKDNLLNEILNTVYNREEKIVNNRCVLCNKLVTIDSFRDLLFLKEYSISGLCQDCQDKIFIDNE